MSNVRKMQRSGGRHTVQYGKRTIAFDLTYSDRKNLAISVHPDLRVTVRAPLGKPVGEITERVARRGNWIIRQLNDLRKFQPLPSDRQYVSGETHLYLGRQYRLKVVTGKNHTVKLKGGYLWVTVADLRDRAHIAGLLTEWYDKHARQVLVRRLEGCLPRAIRAGLPEPKVVLRKLRKSWGSCSRKGTITLNTDLVKAPVQCIDYVITHELCHLRHRNHSREFWALLGRLMPDWENRRKRLERVLI